VLEEGWGLHPHARLPSRAAVGHHSWAVRRASASLAA
jgi:hypothetical protein